MTLKIITLKSKRVNDIFSILMIRVHLQVKVISWTNSFSFKALKISSRSKVQTSWDIQKVCL